MTGEIAAEICASCGHVSLEERGFCNRCGKRDVALGRVAGTGTLWSQTTIFRSRSTEDGPGDPAIIGLIALDAGPRIMTIIPDGLKLDDPVIVHRPTMEIIPTASRAGDKPVGS